MKEKNRKNHVQNAEKNRKDDRRTTTETKERAL